MKALRDDATLERLELYVAALSGRPLRLCWHDEPHALAYCDGGALRVPRARAGDAWLDATLQALLVRQGALAARPMQRLIGRPARARGYLAAELARAVRAHGSWLPRDVLEHAALRELPELPPLHASTDDSLMHARRHELARTPAAWGVLMPSRVLAQRSRQGAGSPVADASSHAARNQALPPGDELEESSILAAFRAPIESTAGLLGSLLQQILQLRSSSADSAPSGAGSFGDAEAHATEAGAVARRVSGTPDRGDTADALSASLEFRYPEWDAGRKRYRPDFVHVAEVEPHPDHARASALPDASAARALRKTLSSLCLGYEPRRHQTQGDDVDVDALVRLRTDTLAGHAGDPRIYRAPLRTRRDLGVLVLLDITGSTAELAADGERVFDRQLGFALALVQALHDSGDRVALYGFHSWGPKIVRVPRVLAFGERPDGRMRERARQLTPVGYSRLGAAIRHGTAVLREHAGTPHRLLVVISDALAYDKGYEGAYAHADTRKALAEARAANNASVCLSIGASTGADALTRDFGGSCFLALPDVLGGERALRHMFERAVAESSHRSVARAQR